MATNQWVRVRSAGNQWRTAQSAGIVAQLNSGQSILRVHLAWGFGGATSASVTPTAVQQNVMTMGLVTVIGNGTEVPPHPVTQSVDQNPPAQRWLYWSVRSPQARTFDAGNSSALWESSPPEEPSSTKGQVLAPSGMGTGNFLDLWFTWVPVGAWDVSGNANLWWAASVLVRTP